jgi:type IV pilus assembly protein PilO
MAFSDQIAALKEEITNIDFSEVQLDNMGSWPQLVKIAAWLGIFLVLLGLGYQFVISDMLIDKERSVAKEVTLKKDFEKKAYEAANLEAYRKQMVEMDESFSALISQLPSDTEVPGLLEDITSKGTSSGLAFKSIDLKAEKKAEFYVQLPIDIEAEGTYHDMGAFVGGVASLPRIVTLTDFSIRPQGGSRDNSKLQIRILASTYRYKDPEKDGSSKKKKKKRR